MRRAVRVLLAAALIASAQLAPSPASADPLQPGDLAVVGQLVELIPIQILTNAVLRVDPATDEREIFSGRAPFGSTVGTGPPIYLGGYIAVERDGSVLFGTGAGLLRIDPVTGDRTVISSSSVGSGPSGGFFRSMAVAHDGTIFSAQEISLGTCSPGEALLRIDPTTGDRTLVSGCGTGSGPEFVRLRDVAVEPSSGDILVVDGIFNVPTISTRLLRVDSASGDRTILAGASSSFNPEQVAVRPDGTILVSVWSDVDLFAVDPDTGDTTVYSGTSLGTGPLFGGYPLGLLVTADGSTLVTDLFVAHILRVDPTTRDRTVLVAAPPVPAEATTGRFADLVEIPHPPPTPALGPRLLAAAALLLGGAGVAWMRRPHCWKQ